MTPLVRDARLFAKFRFSRDGRTTVFTMIDGDEPAEPYAADSGFTEIRRLTTINEWYDRFLKKEKTGEGREQETGDGE
jgi:hypothetical protein